MKRQTRLRFVGIVAATDGATVLARMESLHGPAGWLGHGPILRMHVASETMASEHWHDLTAEAVEKRVQDGINERAAKALEEQDPLF